MPASAEPRRPRRRSPRRPERWFLRAIGLSLLAGAAACHPPPPASKPMSVPPAPTLRMTLGPEDVFEVRVYGEQDLSGLFQVSNDGTFQYPLLGKVQARGKTPAEVVAELRDGLANGFLRSPQVTIFIKEYNSRRIVVYGEVQKPGQFPFLDGMSIAQAISQAGGFTQMAAKDAVVVTRVHDHEQQAFRIDVKAIAEGRASDYYLLPGDQIFVPERIF